MKAQKPSHTPKIKLIPSRGYSPPESTLIVATSGRARRYNGGVKLYNLWIKLLREHDYQAYIATVDGEYDRWLVEHQPVLSYSELDDFRSRGYGVRIMTGWLDTPGLERLVANGRFYYFDADLKWTLYFKKKLDYYLKRNMIAGIATHSRYIQGWYMAEYGIKPLLVNEWSDTDIFYPAPQERVAGRVGCMAESEQDDAIYQFLAHKGSGSQWCESVTKIKGDEASVAEAMRTTDIFVGLNQGKHPLWGEGCPRTQQEAMHCGCALVAFDVLGNREYLYDGWTGLLVPPRDLEGLWNSIQSLLENEEEKEQIRANGLNLVKGLFRADNKIGLVESFLGLTGMTKDELASILDKPFWLHEYEVPYLARCAASSPNTIVEIGSAFGGSTVVFLTNKQPSAHVYSIDPFVPDSTGRFRATRRECVRAVKKALKRTRYTSTLGQWTLIEKHSHEAVKGWDKQIDLLFIDGSHRYEDVRQDFEQWSPSLSRDGRILIHDSRREDFGDDPEEKVFSRGWSGPTRLVDELSESEEFEVEDTCYSITALKRKGTK